MLLGVDTYCVVASKHGIMITTLQNDKQDEEAKTNIWENTNNEFIMPLSDKDFVLKVNNNIINKNLANDSFAYNVYIFESFKIMIISIDLTSSEIQTLRGINVGDARAEILNKYGNPDKENVTKIRESYMYYYEECLLTFYVDSNGKVSSIRFEFI